MTRSRMRPLSLAAMIAIGGEFSVSVPMDWDQDDQWFRQVPFAGFSAPGEPPDRRLSVERYRRDDPLGLTPTDLVLAMGEEGAAPKTTRRKVGKKTFTVYEVEKRPGPARAPHVDEDADVLGPGKPGIRSKIERCRGRGAYRLPAAYNSARLDAERLDLFRKVHLGYDRQRKVILACLGPGALGAIEQGEPLPELKEPDEADIARQERLEREDDPLTELQAAAIVESKDRFYVLRYTASTGTYRQGLADFDAFLGSFKVLNK